MPRNVVVKEIGHLPAGMEIDEREIFVRLIEGFTNIKRPPNMAFDEIEDMIDGLNPEIGERLKYTAQAIMEYLGECLTKERTVN